MNYLDFEISETGNGGDMVQRGNDISTVSGVENMPYLACFGGSDFWANDLLDEGDAVQFLCETEVVLNSVPLNSTGRILIEQAVARDLEFLKRNFSGTDIKIVVAIVTDDRVDINITINAKLIALQWNPATKTFKEISKFPKVFSDEFDDSFG